MSESSSMQAGCCSSSGASAELKLYQAFIFSIPIFFAFVLLFMFYLFYLRRRRADWSSLRMRTSLDNNNVNGLSIAELGIRKEVREMLPIIIYKETFSIKDTQCSVCLGDYQGEDKLQQIPACGHTFHMDCIDHWLANHTTCPLCRLSVLASPKASDKLHVSQAQNCQEPDHSENGNRSNVQPMLPSCDETQGVEPTTTDATILQHNSEETEVDDQGREFRNTRNETREHELNTRISA